MPTQGEHCVNLKAKIRMMLPQNGVFHRLPADYQKLGHRVYNSIFLEAFRMKQILVQTSNLQNHETIQLLLFKSPGYGVL